MTLLTIKLHDYDTVFIKLMQNKICKAIRKVLLVLISDGETYG